MHQWLRGMDASGCQVILRSVFQWLGATVFC